MTFGAALLLIAVGAILRYAVTADVSGVDIDEVGLILMIVGIIGFVIALIYALFWAGEQSRWHRWRRTPYERPYPPDEPPRTY
jgi:Domain of unknown function (DUF6458)